MIEAGAEPRAILFDLDGTLADTAPDLIGALNDIRRGLNLGEVDPAPLRSRANQGALAILEAGLPELRPARRKALHARFLQRYRERCWQDSRPFDGMPDCLDRIEVGGWRWGVVTNKLEALAREVVRGAGWLDRAGCLIGGDSADRPKPAPDPVLAACQVLGVAPARAVMIGDDRRDVLAGRAAGARTIAVRWGYLLDGEDPSTWGADTIVDHPRDLSGLLGLSEVTESRT